MVFSTETSPTGTHCFPAMPLTSGRDMTLQCVESGFKWKINPVQSYLCQYSIHLGEIWGHSKMGPFRGTKRVFFHFS